MYVFIPNNSDKISVIRLLGLKKIFDPLNLMFTKVMDSFSLYLCFLYEDFIFFTWKK